MQVNRPTPTGPAYDNKQGAPSAAPTPRPPQPRMYTAAPQPLLVPGKQTEGGTSQSAEGAHGRMKRGVHGEHVPHGNGHAKPKGSGNEGEGSGNSHPEQGSLHPVVGNGNVPKEIAGAGQFAVDEDFVPQPTRPDHLLRNAINPQVSFKDQTPNAQGVYNIGGQAYVQVDGNAVRIQGVSTTHGIPTANAVDDKGNLLTAGNLVRNENGQWQQLGTTQGGGGALGKTKDPHARFFADKEKRAKKTTENLARQSFDEVRSAYEGGKKSNNKTYVHTSPKGGSSRDDMQDEAGTLLDRIRDKNRANHNKPIDQKTVFPADNPLRIDAGNCGELSGALAKTVTEKGGYAETWTFANKKHMFTVIGDPRIPHLQTDDFSQWKGVWIGDPWANIFVEAPKYPQAFREKMQKWASEGKLIEEGNQVISPTDPKWVNAVDGVKLQHEAPEVDNPNPWKFQTYTA